MSHGTLHALWSFLGAGFVTAYGLVQAQAGGWPTAPWPDFAQQRDIPVGEAHGATDDRQDEWENGGYHSLLLDTFIYFESAAVSATLVREVIAYHNEHGLDLRGDLSVSFIPGEEELLLVHLRRRGFAQDEFVDLEYGVSLEHAGKVDGMYVDERTVAFIPDGVSPGDIVDFAYVVLRRVDRSFGPWDYLETDDYVAPVSSRHIEVSAPRDMGLRQVARGFEKARLIQEGDRVRFVFDARDLGAVALPARLPRSFEPFRALLFTEARNWQEVSSPYAEHLSRLPISDAVARLAKSALAGHAEDPVAVLADLVRRRIRYVGLEISGHRLVPDDPALTLARGWGDCKDMSLLLVQMLKSTGIEAYPALARTTDLGPIDPDMPSIAAFNHEIVAVRRDGTWLFVDPTIKEAIPPWAGAVWPGQRLLVIGGEAQLVEAGVQPDGLDSVEVDAHGRFVAAGAGLVRFELESLTTYAGPAANAMRRRMREEGAAAVRNEAQEFFATAVTGMALSVLEESSSPAVMELQTLAIRERLVFEGKRTVREPRYFPPELGQLLDLPPVAGRTVPLGLEHPRHIAVRLTLEDDLGGGPSIAPDLRYDGEFLEVSRTSQPVSHGVRYTFVAKTREEQVPVDALPEFAREIAAISAELSVPISAGTAAPRVAASQQSSSSFPSAVTWLLALGLGAGAWVALLMARRPRR